MTTPLTGAERDRLEARRVEERRARYDNIAERIHNVRQRVIGQDIQALEMQIEERKAREQQERDQAYRDYKMACEQAEAMNRLELEKQQAQRDKLRQINEFNRTYMTPESRREFDIYDPRAVSKDMPIRTMDRNSDILLPISSGQVMEGEDLDKNQKDLEKTLKWKEELEKDIAYRAEQRKRQKELEELEIEEENAARAEVQRKMLAEEEARKEARRQVEDFNKQQLEYQKEQKAMQKQIDDEMMKEHMKNYDTMGFMSEDPYSGEFYGNPNRHNPSQYRGMLPADIERVRAEQEAHAAAVIEQRERERKEQIQEEQEQAAVNRQLLLQERENKRLQREKARQYQETLVQQDTIRKGQDATMKTVYENEMTDDFFNRMGRDWR